MGQNLVHSGAFARTDRVMCAGGLWFRALGALPVVDKSDFWKKSTNDFIAETAGSTLRPTDFCRFSP